MHQLLGLGALAVQNGRRNRRSAALQLEHRLRWRRALATAVEEPPEEPARQWAPAGFLLLGVQPSGKASDGRAAGRRDPCELLLSLALRVLFVVPEPPQARNLPAHT
jgi:hypothetical protein